VVWRERGWSLEFFPPNANRCLSNVLTDAGRPPKNPHSRSPCLGGGKKNARKNILCAWVRRRGDDFLRSLLFYIRTLTQKTLVIGHRRKEDAVTFGVGISLPPPRESSNLFYSCQIFTQLTKWSPSVTASAAHVCALTEKASVWFGSALGNHNNNHHHLASALLAGLLVSAGACGIGWGWGRPLRCIELTGGVMEQCCGFAVVMQTKCSACVHFPMRCVFIFGSRTDTVAKCETDGAARKSHIKSMSRVMGKIRALCGWSNFVFASHVHELRGISHHIWSLLQDRWFTHFKFQVKNLRKILVAYN
jgi:hypothetical protein